MATVLVVILGAECHRIKRALAVRGRAARMRRLASPPVRGGVERRPTQVGSDADVLHGYAEGVLVVSRRCGCETRASGGELRRSVGMERDVERVVLYSLNTDARTPT